MNETHKKMVKFTSAEKRVAFEGRRNRHPYLGVDAVEKPNKTPFLSILMHPNLLKYSH